MSGISDIITALFPGSRVTSTVRSPAHNAAVGGAANSYHLPGRPGQAGDFIPPGGMASLTKQQIRDRVQAQGYQILELLGPGDKGHSDHFHLAISNASISDPSALSRAQDIITGVGGLLLNPLGWGEGEGAGRDKLKKILGQDAGNAAADQAQGVGDALQGPGKWIEMFAGRAAFAIVGLLLIAAAIFFVAKGR